jgi:hypothetical protein
MFYNFNSDYRKIAGGKQALTPAAGRRFLSCVSLLEYVELNGRSVEQNTI